MRTSALWLVVFVIGANLFAAAGCAAQFTAPSSPAVPAFQPPAKPAPAFAPPPIEPSSTAPAPPPGANAQPPIPAVPPTVPPTGPINPQNGPSAPFSFEQPPANIPVPNYQPATPAPITQVRDAAFTPAQIVAVVGNQHVLAGEIDGNVNQMMAITVAALSPEDRDRFKDELEKQREGLFRNQLMSEVQTKLVYLDFVRMIPSEKLPDVQKRISSEFERDLENMRQKVAEAKKDELDELIRRDPIVGRLAIIMKQERIESLGELDQILRRYGSTLERQRRASMEHKVGQMMIFRNIKQNVEITHEQMLEYYREHATDYAIPAKAKWEQLTVKFDKFPSREAAFQAIAGMGNEVYLGGAQLAAVAKAKSQEPNAEQGGLHDWTSKGSLASKVLDDAIFSLPLNKLSQILEDERGYHILRVLDRRDASSVPFVEAQIEIKDKIKNLRRQQDIKQYLEKIQKGTQVWTIYDDEKQSVETARKAAERPAGAPR